MAALREQIRKAKEMRARAEEESRLANENKERLLSSASPEAIERIARSPDVLSQVGTSPEVLLRLTTVVSTTGSNESLPRFTPTLQDSRSPPKMLDPALSELSAFPGAFP